MPTAWTLLRAALDPIARRLGHYTAYPLDASEHVDTVDLGGGVGAVVDALRDRAYEPQYLSAAKRHPETNQLHDASYRRVPERHPAAADGSPLAETFAPAECQYHVHAFEADGGVGVFSHYEARPDLFAPTVSLQRLRTHYRPAWGETYLQGVSDLDFGDA